jgi:hypothetical protein
MDTARCRAILNHNFGKQLVVIDVFTRAESELDKSMRLACFLNRRVIIEILEHVVSLWFSIGFRAGAVQLTATADDAKGGRTSRHRY